MTIFPRTTIPHPRLRTTRAFGRVVCTAALSLLAAVAPAAPPSPAPTNLVEIVLEPLKPTYFDGGPIEIRFKYSVRRSLPRGTVEVRMQNTDTGDVVIKRFPADLSLGEHRAWAMWGGAGADNSSEAAAADDLLEGDTRRQGALPDGLYIPRVVILAADGALLADRQYSPDQVRHMIASGKASRVISKASVEQWVSDIQRWNREILALESNAVAAGANTTLPHLMVTALRQTAATIVGYAGSRSYDVVQANHRYLARELPKTRQQLEQLTREPTSGVNADIMPRPRDRMTIRNGYFHAGDQPVFMNGWCMFALWPDLELMREFGYNLVHIGASPGCIFPDSEEPTGKLLVADYNNPRLTVRRFLDECSRLGIKTDLGLNMHPLPKWFLEKNPDAKLQGHSVAGFIPFDTEHPASVRLTERFLDAAMAEIADHPALNSIWLANEPTMLNWGPLSMALYREHLREKYGSLEKLNSVWGTTLTSFDEVKHDIKDSPQSRVDFWWFNLGRLTHFFTRMQACVRKHDKAVPTCFKLNNLQMGWYCPPMNVDQEGVTDISQITGMDSGTYPFAKPYYDWLRSLSPDQPVVNLEFKGGGSRTRLDIWKGALHGLAGIDWWCWHPKPAFSGAMCYTEALHEGALATYNIQRLLPQVMAFQEFPRSPFVVLYPDPVLPRAWNYFQVHTPAVNALKMMGYAVDYVTEKRLAQGRLEAYPYRILVMPAANWIRDETLKRAETFVRGGGIAITIGGLPEQDEMEKPRELGWLKAPDDARAAFGDPTNGVVYACGKGRVWQLPAVDEKRLVERLDAIAGQELPPQPIIVRDVENRTLPWTNSRGEKTWMTYLLNEWLEAPYTIKLRYNVPMRRGVDLITGTDVDLDAVTLPPAGVCLIEWTPASP